MGSGPFRTTPVSAVRNREWKLIYFYEDGLIPKRFQGADGAK